MGEADAEGQAWVIDPQKQGVIHIAVSSHYVVGWCVMQGEMTDFGVKSGVMPLHVLKELALA